MLNESSGAKGQRGLLALREADDRTAPKGRGWRRRKGRLAASRVTGEESALEALKEAAQDNDPAFRSSGEGPAHLSKDESAYKASGPSPRFAERSPDRPKK